MTFALLVLAYVACSDGVAEPVEPAERTCDACAGACTEQTAPATGSAHVSGTVAYPDYPPSSGDHNACWAPWGVHVDTVATENWVHNLEHGGVVLLYDAAAIHPGDLATLTTWVESLAVGRAVLTAASAPLDGLGAAVSWEHRLVLGCVDTGALAAFFDAHVAQAPEDVTSNPSETCGLDEDTAADTARDTAWDAVVE